MKARQLVRPVMGSVLAGALALSIAAVSAQSGDAQPFLGITFANDPDGARITGVMPGGPADEAGLEIGDIVQSVNGEDVTGDSIAGLIAGMDVGDTVNLSVDRGADTLDIEATLASRDEALNFPQATEGQAAQTQQGAFLGVSLQDTDEGLTIQDVVPDSPAEKAGLQAGDVITAVDGDAIENGLQLTSAIRALNPGDTVTLDITRDGEAQTMEALLAEAPAQPVPPTNMPNLPMNPMGGMVAEGFGVDVEGTNWTINELSEDHPLYAAGLRQGDVVTEFNGEAYDPQALLQAIATMDPTATVTLTVERDGATQQIDVPTSDLMQLAMPGMGFDFRDLGRMFGQGQNGQNPMGRFPFDFNFNMPFGGAMAGGRLGVTVQNLDEQVASDNNLTVTDGALVQEVAPDSAAAEAGLQANDVITAVDGDAVDAEHTLRDRLVAYEPGDTITLTVLRDGATQEIQATLSEANSRDEFRFFGRPDQQPVAPDAQPTEAAPSA